MEVEVQVAAHQIAKALDWQIHEKSYDKVLVGK